MLNLSSADVCQSTKEKACKWDSQPCIKEGLLPLFDAACLMAEFGYGGIWETLSRDSKNEVQGFLSALDSALDEKDRLEGYHPYWWFVNGDWQNVYPVSAFLAYCERTGNGDKTYFERRERELGKATTKSLRTQSEQHEPKKDTEEAPPFDWCESDLLPSLDDECAPNEPNKTKRDEVHLFQIQKAVVRMLELCIEDFIVVGCRDGEDVIEFQEPLAQKLEEALLDSVEASEYRLRLAGYEVMNPLNVSDARKAKFPREAYYQWWKDCDHGLPCPAWFEDLRKADEATEADGAAEVCEVGIGVDNVPPPEEFPPSKPEELPGNGGMEVVPGVTVSDLRSMLDCNSPMYCPRLLAAILTKIEVMPDEKKDKDGFIRLPPVKESDYKNEVGKVALKRLESLGVVNCVDGSRKPSPAKGDASAVARVLWRTLDGKNGRPKNL